MAGALQSTPPDFETATRETALGIVAPAAALLFVNGQTTERTVVAAERLGRALGVPTSRSASTWGSEHDDPLSLMSDQ